MASFFVFILLFITPFVIFPFGNAQFEPPKVIFSEILIDFLIMTLLLQKGINFFVSLDKKQVFLAGLIFLLSFWHLLFLLTPITFFGNAFRMQGVFLLWHLLALSLIASKIKFPKVREFWYLIMLFVIFVSSLILGNPNARAVATLGEPNALAAFIVFLLPFIFFVDYNSKKLQKLVRILSFIAAFIIILLSGSKSGFLALTIEALFYFLAFRTKIALKNVILIITFCIVLVYFLPVFSNNLYENRVDVWKTALVSGFEHPLLGAGFGNTEIQLRKTSLATHNMLIGYYVDSAHNLLFDWWVQGGIAGLSLLLCTIFITIQNFYKKLKKFELIVLSGLIIMLSFNPASVVTLLGFWWIVGRSFAKID